jgi:hypothetical protein
MTWRNSFLGGLAGWQFALVRPVARWDIKIDGYKRRVARIPDLMAVTTLDQ